MPSRVRDYSGSVLLPEEAFRMPNPTTAQPETKRNDVRGRGTRRIVAAEMELISEMADAIKPGLKSRMLATIEGPSGLTVMVVMALFALYGTDLWEACGPPPMRLDPIIYSFATLVFVFFMTELLLLAWCKKHYMLSFFFWLDLMAVMSLIPDVCMLFEIDVFSLLGGGEGGLTIARTARAARAGARSARIVRSMKFLSLVQRVKRRGKDNNYDKSKIGGRLASGVTQKMIIVIGFMLFATSMLDILSRSFVDSLAVLHSHAHMSARLMMKLVPVVWIQK